MNTDPVSHPQHHVLVYVGNADQGFMRADIFQGTWDAAQFVWKALDDQRLAGDLVTLGVHYFAVRSADDPQVKEAFRGYQSPYSASQRLQNDILNTVRRRADSHFRAYRRKKLGALALAAVKDESLETFAQVVNKVRADAAYVGLELYSPHEAWDAAKQRVHLGRSAEFKGDRRAYFAPKSMGRLGDLRSPDGHRLYATSSSFGGSFARLRKAS